MSWTSDVRTELAALDLSARALRSFGLVLGGLLVAAGAWLGLRRGLPAAGAALGGGGLLLAGLGLAAPARLRLLYRAWMAFAFALGWVVSRGVLAALFLLAVAPMGLLARVLGKRFLELGSDPALPSYWVRREPGRRSDYRKLHQGKAMGRLRIVAEYLQFLAQNKKWWLLPIVLLLLLLGALIVLTQGSPLAPLIYTLF